jgi:hypothetical protein
LTDELQWVPVGDLKVGDGLITFEESSTEEFGNGHGGRRYQKARVIGIESEMATVVDVETSDGEILTVTLDHGWLVKNEGSSAKWLTTKSFNRGPSSNLHKIIPPWDEKKNYMRGYLAGIFDGEGTILPSSHQLGFTQKPGVVLDRATTYLKKMGIPFTVGLWNGNKEGSVHTVHITGSLSERLSVLGKTRPERLISKLNPDLFGRLHFNGNRTTAQIVGKPYRSEITKITTNTGTLIIEGYPMHNCDEAWAVVDNWDQWRKARELDIEAMRKYLRDIGASNIE